MALPTQALNGDRRKTLTWMEDIFSQKYERKGKLAEDKEVGGEGVLRFQRSRKSKQQAKRVSMKNNDRPAVSTQRRGTVCEKGTSAVA